MGRTGTLWQTDWDAEPALVPKAAATATAAARETSRRVWSPREEAAWSQVKAAAEKAKQQRQQQTNPSAGHSPAAVARQRGNAAFKAGSWGNAEAAYTEAIQLDGGDGAALSFGNRASARRKLGKLLPAVQDCEQAVRLASTVVKYQVRHRPHCHLLNAARHSYYMPLAKQRGVQTTNGTAPADTN